MSRFDEHTFLAWQRNIRLAQAFQEQAPAPSPAVGTATPTARCPIPRGAVTVRRSSTPSLEPVTPAAPSILTEDWFTGFIPRDEEYIDDPDGDEVEKVTDELGWYVDEVEHYLAPRRTQDAIRRDEETLAWLLRFDSDAERRVDERCGDREFLSYQLGQVRVELEELIRQAQAATGRSRKDLITRDPQIRRKFEHAFALREAYNYRRYCAALGWSTYKRIAFKRKLGSYAKANTALDGMVRRRNARAAMGHSVDTVMVHGLVATRLRRLYPLGTGGTHLRQAA